MIEQRFPIFIPSKGRWKTRHTVKMFDRIGTSYRVFVEPQEYGNYAAVIDSGCLVVLPHSNEGLVVTRNFIWDYAVSVGVEYFWTFDDNIRNMYRFDKNKKRRVFSSATLRACEEFIARFSNVVIGGMNYLAFGVQRDKALPFTLNTRVYSNMLIKADAPYRNEGFYNDDTDLCLRVLKDGLCTILFNAFLIDKEVTMTVAGGMTPHYKDDGRWKMAKELQMKHPDVVKITRKWGRWQHQVDYRPFKKNKLIRRKGVVISKGVNNYGMTLVKQPERIQ